MFVAVDFSTDSISLDSATLVFDAICDCVVNGSAKLAGTGAVANPGTMYLPTRLAGVCTTFFPSGITVNLLSANFPVEGFTPFGFFLPLIFSIFPVFSSRRDSFFVTIAGLTAKCIL